jgi:hypothetical protein
LNEPQACQKLPYPAKRGCITIESIIIKRVNDANQNNNRKHQKGPNIDIFLHRFPFGYAYNFLNKAHTYSELDGRLHYLYVH